MYFKLNYSKIDKGFYFGNSTSVNNVIYSSVSLKNRICPSPQNRSEAASLGQLPALLSGINFSNFYVNHPRQQVFLRKGCTCSAHDYGCGFVFDCRGIENPGLLPELAPQTGLDADVQKFLIDTTTIPDFLLAIKTIIDISIVKYFERGFTDLSINFGCTGGRHRSVYAAETTVDYLKKKYGESVKLSITHTNI